MPINGYFDQVFANSGDKTAVPDPTQGSGTVSYQQGFPVGYSTPVGSGGFNFPRYQHNQILYDITSAIQKIQQGSAPPFITSTMNGGTPYSYPLNATVTLGGVTYVSNTGGNTDTPPSSKWTVFSLNNSNLFIAGTSTGSANAQVLASLNPASGFSLSNPGDTIVFTVGFTNTNAATMAVTTPAIAATAIQKNSGSGLVALSGGEMVAGNIATLTVSNSGTLVLDAGLPSTLFAPIASKNIQNQVINSSGTFTTPANTLSTTVFKFTVTGAGGGGSGGQSSGSGGGAGATAIYYASGLAASTGYAVGIGSGGAAGSSTGGAGGAGGNSTVVIGATTVTAGGGSGGANAAAGPGGAGGTSTNGTINIPGGGGNIGSISGPADAGGAGGASLWGGGGPGSASTTGSAGSAGTAPGSGGSGSNGGSGFAGGAGANGLVLVEWVL